MSNKELQIVILIPRFDRSGPIKGALALANGLEANGQRVVVLPMFRGHYSLNDIPQSSILLKANTLLKKREEFRKFIGGLAETRSVKIISFCLQPDFLTLISGFRKISISSIRGNLFQNYKMAYGVSGILVALMHYLIVSKFKWVTVLNGSMKRQIERVTKHVVIIKNFIDEVDISRTYNVNATRSFIFVGSLSRRKAILELVDTFFEIHIRGYDFKLSILGIGPLEDTLRRKIVESGLSAKIVLHGQVENPFLHLNQADVFILPSWSEGTSRAALEALFAGIPCILRNVDSNEELIQSSKQGYLFETNSDLRKLIENYIDTPEKTNFCRLPEEYRQKFAVKSYIKLLNQELQ